MDFMRIVSKPGITVFYFPGSQKVSSKKNKEQHIPAFTRKRDFIKSHLGHVTKCDQYKAMKSFENNVVSILHASDKGLLTGDRIVRKLRRRLKKVGS